MRWKRLRAGHAPGVCRSARSSGQSIGTMDTMIAAHVLAERLTLVTRHTKRFMRLEGLAIEDWVVSSSAVPWEKLRCPAE